MSYLQNHGQRRLLVQSGLDLHLRAQRAKYCLKWGSLNALFLAALMCDLSQKCPYAQSNWYLLEYAATLIVALSMVACFFKYFLYLFNTPAVEGTVEQKNLLKFDANDNSFVTPDPNVVEKPKSLPQPTEQEANNTILSWHSSFNDSPYLNYSTQRYSNSPQQQQQQNSSFNSSMANNSTMNASSWSSNASSFMSPYAKRVRSELISDERSLHKYLTDFTTLEQNVNDTNDLSAHQRTSGKMNSFWSYYNTAANLLKTSLYQLAPVTPTTTQNKQLTSEETGLNVIDGHSELIKRISSEKLSQYVAYLRRWTSSTILLRLLKEIQLIDESFKHRGLVDMQLGAIGIERLKKTVENQQFINQFMPMLPLIVPFLDVSSNQEYLVQRIKDLAKSSCISDYRWNSGAAFHGVEWDEHLPSDSAILFHLFCVYLDTQLLPLPQGGGRPFYNRYVIVADGKRTAKDILDTVLNKARCAILCTNPQRPKFNFISDDKVHNCAYDRNNLFYVIIQFLFYMKTHNDSVLEGVNLGKSGINLMCVIED